MDFAEALAWYTHLASQPGWKEYAWHRVQQMARETPALFGELPAALTKAMKERTDGDRVSVGPDQRQA